MFRKQILLAIAAILIVTLACGVDVPITTDIKTGETVTDEILVPSLGDATADITLQFGAGELNILPGTDGALINGRATYNVPDFEPEISIDGSNVKISTGSLEVEGIPNFDKKIENTWDLSLGYNPIDLTIKAGAYVGDYELGGLTLSNLHVSDGAAEVELNFAQPNRIVMQTLRYETGASNVSLSNLANANFQTMIFESGAGNYELDFCGGLQNDAAVFIETGLSSMSISVPEGVNANVSVEGGLTNITVRGAAWEQSGDNYTLSGTGPTLTITVEMGAGNLILRTP
ncbi:MAG: hypothetical protein KKD28_10540 [Chloroflexi bacterium]|nr:hypothetical protein [Chloroflexota bacterium]MBU1661893.1 hypothetical protein [Chloroflexota bacterium]